MHGARPSPPLPPVFISALAVCALGTACNILGLGEVPCDDDAHCDSPAVCLDSGLCGPSPAGDGDGDGDGEADGGVDGGVDASPDAGDPPEVCIERPFELPDDVELETGIRPVYVNDGFDYGLKLLGDIAEPGANGDVVTVPRGDADGVAGWAHADPEQGTVIVYVQTFYEGLDVEEPIPLFELSGFALRLLPEGHAEVRWRDATGERAAFFDRGGEGVRGGEMTSIALRWDTRRPIIDGAHITLTVEENTYPAQLEPFAPPEVRSQMVVGGAGVTCPRAADAIVVGAHVFRRVLSDGESGVGVTRDDELAAFFLGLGDPTMLGGAWDVVLGVPTLQSAAALEEGAAAGHAWSFPRGANLLAPGGWLRTGTAEGDGFAVDGVEVAPLETEEKIFAGGVRVTSPDDGGAISFTLPATLGDELVVRAIAHSPGASIPTLEVWTNGQGPLGVAEGEPVSTRERPVELITTLETFSDEDLVVFLYDGYEDGGSIAWHQVEAYRNLVDNPSFSDLEPSDDCGGCLVPRGWSAEPLGNLVGVTQVEPGHSHPQAVRLASADGAGDKFFRTVPDALEPLRFYSIGGFFYREDTSVAGEIFVTDGAMFPQGGRAGAGNNYKFFRNGSGVTNAWQHIAGVGRRQPDAAFDTPFDHLRFGTRNGIFFMRMDDAYVVPLDEVWLTFQPADLPTSTSSGFIRVDGADALRVPAAPLTAAEGRLTLPFHLGALESAFAPPCINNEYPLVRVLGPADGLLARALIDGNWMRFYFDLEGNSQLNETVFDIRPEAGVPTELVLQWSLPGTIEVWLDDVLLVEAPFDVGLEDPPLYVVVGGLEDNGQCDLAVQAPGPILELP